MLPNANSPNFVQITLLLPEDRLVRAKYFEIPYPIEKELEPGTLSDCLRELLPVDLRDPRMRVVVPTQPFSGPRSVFAGSGPIMDSWNEDVRSRKNALKRAGTRASEVKSSLTESKHAIQALEERVQALEKSGRVLEERGRVLEERGRVLEERGRVLEEDNIRLNSRLGHLESILAEQEGPVVMFSVLHHLNQRSKGRYPCFRPVKGDHPVCHLQSGHFKKVLSLRFQDKVTLRKAVEEGKDGLTNLIRESPLAQTYFTLPSIEAFLASFTVNSRHISSHLEYVPARLLRRLLALELARRQVWKGEPGLCPETIALRLFLSSIGPSRARELITELEVNDGGVYETLRQEELLPITFLL